MQVVNKVVIAVLFFLAFANVYAQESAQDSTSESERLYSLKYKILSVHNADERDLSSMFQGLDGYEYKSFFCRKEQEIEEETQLPLRFRLGTLRYADKLEGKFQ